MLKNDDVAKFGKAVGCNPSITGSNPVITFETNWDVGLKVAIV